MTGQRDARQLLQEAIAGTFGALVLEPGTECVLAGDDGAAALLGRQPDLLVGARLGDLVRLLGSDEESERRWVEAVAIARPEPTLFLLRRRLRGGEQAVLLRGASEWDDARRALRLMTVGVEHAPDGFEITDADGIIEYANPAHAGLVDRPLFDVLGASFFDLLVDEADRQSLASAFAAGRAWRGEVRCRHGHERLMVHDLILTPVPGTSRPDSHFVIVRRDVTERVEAARNAEVLRAQLAHADRLSTVGRLAATVAHEVNNPATSVMVNLQLMADALANGSSHGVDELRELVGDALVGIRRVATHVRDLQRLARASPENPAVLALNDAVDDAVRVTRPQMPAHAQLTVTLGPDTMVRADRVRLGQVAVNLIVNAFHAVDTQRDRNAHITVATERDQQWVKLRVSDDGPGIRHEDLPRLFEPFFTTKPADVGTGLGLAVCREIVTASGGDIRVDSELGAGATVIVRWPYVGDDASHHP